MNNVVNSQVTPPTQQPIQPPLHMKYMDGGGRYSVVLPPTYLDVCNFCTKKIRHDEDRYMNG